MKKRLAIGTLVAALVIGGAAFAFAQSPGGYWGGGWGYRPTHMGPMVGGYGYGMGPGMMGWGYGPGCGGWRGGAYAPTAAQPLIKENATRMLQTYVARTGNPNLKLGDLTETDTTFEGKVVTKDGSLVEKLVVDKSTGWVQQTF